MLQGNWLPFLTHYRSDPSSQPVVTPIARTKTTLHRGDALLSFGSRIFVLGSRRLDPLSQLFTNTAADGSWLPLSRSVTIAQ